MDLGPEAVSPWLREGMVRLGATVPFAQAADLLRHFTGTTLSPSTLRRTTVAAGTVMRHLAADLTASVAAGTAPVPPPPASPMQLSVDGSLLRIVGEGWREVRVASIGVLSTEPPAPDEARATALTHVAALCDAETFTWEALGEVGRRGLDQAATVTAVSDGATWIQTFVDVHTPHARRVLDFSHAAGYLAQAAQASFGPGTAQTSAWFAT